MCQKEYDLEESPPGILMCPECAASMASTVLFLNSVNKDVAEDRPSLNRIVRFTAVWLLGIVGAKAAGLFTLRELVARLPILLLVLVAHLSVDLIVWWVLQKRRQSRQSTVVVPLRSTDDSMEEGHEYEN